VGVSEGAVRKDITAEEVRTGTHLAPAEVAGQDGKALPGQAPGSTPARSGDPLLEGQALCTKLAGLQVIRTCGSILEATEVPTGAVRGLCGDLSAGGTASWRGVSEQLFRSTLERHAREMASRLSGGVLSHAKALPEGNKRGAPGWPGAGPLEGEPSEIGHAGRSAIARARWVASAVGGIRRPR